MATRRTTEHHSASLDPACVISTARRRGDIIWTVSCRSTAVRCRGALIYRGDRRSLTDGWQAAESPASAMAGEKRDAWWLVLFVEMSLCSSNENDGKCAQLDVVGDATYGCTVACSNGGVNS